MLVVTFEDAPDRSRAMPLVPTAVHVYYKLQKGKTWDLSPYLLEDYSPAAYQSGVRQIALAKRLAAGLLWPVCQRGERTTLLPQGYVAQLPRARGAVYIGIWTGDYLTAFQLPFQGFAIVLGVWLVYPVAT